ncbi:unnamed protein product [Vitrella brassicaformis CCMP3155]|uniref:N-acetyltransferase domain-containing protein n=2 Tax=Vitrella brassicaformis TaxID=1169539 RepID=A0A0G4H107_VITBC|nr:unnamed protein product [Vitrella brassicaformis CCMP3155]|eukprot:CEM37235.1 unnamed protein product [Vitrella brassicaformis CCMP3155]
MRPQDSYAVAFFLQEALPLTNTSSPPADRVLEIIQEADKAEVDTSQSQQSDIVRLVATDQDTNSIVGHVAYDSRKRPPTANVGFDLGDLKGRDGCGQLRADEKLPYVADLAVDAAHRNHGLGSLLLSMVCSHAVSQGHESIYLAVEESNTSARRWYEKRGFHEEANDGHGVIFMAKGLRRDERTE